MGTLHAHHETMVFVAGPLETLLGTLEGSERLVLFLRYGLRDGVSLIVGQEGQ